jgi:Ca-activated chloride channel family protein
MSFNFASFNFIEFDYPYVLSAFLVFIPVILFDILPGLRKNKPELPAELQKKLLFSVFFFRLFAAFSIIALSGPRWGTGYAASEYRRSLDTVFAIDVSRSMDIRDAQTGSGLQTRLERGLSIAKDSAVSVSGARYAAVLGRSRGYLSVPLTYDNETVFNFLESLDISSVTGRSTNLESLLETAISAFQNNSAARKVIVLISDGESHSGILRNALSRCAGEGIIVTAIAVGSDEGMPVPGTLNEQNEVISRRNASVMRMAAERTGGLFIDAVREDSSVTLSSHLLSLAQETKTASSSASSPAGGRTESKQRHSLFIILAIIAYAFSKFIPRLSIKRFLRKSLILGALIFTSCQDGKLLLMEANYLFSRGRYDDAVIRYQRAMQFKDAAPYAEYNLGLTLYFLDETEAALNRYDNSKKIIETLSENEHRELRYRILYNSGIVYFEQDNFVSAAQAFKQALRIMPERIDAKRNLEISLKSIVIDTNREKPGESRNETREILFDYIKQHEQQYWKSAEWADEEQFTGNDY